MFCPDCGEQLEYIRSINDVPTLHDRLECKKCKTEWEFTFDNEDELLHIAPIEEEK